MNKRSFILILSLSTWLSCSKDEIPPAIVDIPVTFQLEMREKLGAGVGERPLEIHIKSVDRMDCLNYRVDYDFSKNGRNLYLALKDFALSEPCVPGEGPAKAALTLGKLDKGNFPLVISLKDIIENEGLILVSNQSYTIKLKTSDGILFSPASLLRIPDNALWGEVFAASDSVSAYAESFMEELEQICGPLNLNAGNYGFFQIQENRSLLLLEPATTTGAASFYFSYNGTREILANLVSQYRDRGGDDLMIKLFDSIGNSY